MELIMRIKYLVDLNEIVNQLLEDKDIKKIKQGLKIKIQKSTEPFVWSVINKETFLQNLPSNIGSIWIFVLKKNTPSIAHYHPNSDQHTIMVEGKGKIRIGESWKDLAKFDLLEENNWNIIQTNTPHEFFPEGEDMVVISFHTCQPTELIEIKCESGESRVYEK
jgi:quercetin dioxygenase-like cupin family protein